MTTSGRWRWPRPVTLAALVVAMATLVSCRVDVAVDIEVTESGGGTITVSAIADPDLIGIVPRLVEDLALDDLAAAGWTVQGPATTEEGGLEVSATREVADLAGMNAALAQLGGPLDDIRITRSDEFARTAWDISGRTTPAEDTGVFADTELLDALGAEPLAEDLAERGLTLADVASTTLRIRLPGDPVSTTGTFAEGVVSWQVPLDGTSLDLATVTERVDDTARRARTTADVARFVMVVWILVTAPFVVWVLLARRRRRIARRRRATPLA